MNMNNKETWIDETLKSIEGIKAPQVSTSLDEKILKHLFQDEIRIISIRPQLTWAIAASLVLLIGLNCFTLISYSKNKQGNQQTEAYAMYTNYFSYTEQL